MSVIIVLRVLQVLVFLLVLPMIALGVMASLSGGGVTPAFQEIGGRLIGLSFFVSLPLLIASEVIHRWLKLTPVSLILLVIPLIMWGWLLVRLQRETGFFIP